MQDKEILKRITRVIYSPLIGVSAIKYIKKILSEVGIIIIKSNFTI